MHDHDRRCASSIIHQDCASAKPAGGFSSRWRRRSCDRSGFFGNHMDNAGTDGIRELSERLQTMQR
ncbi:MAG: hypothetical protein EB114_10065 [Betaproteobacteria bacterium]|nr:hypothetical protein [Betaproteobacteria bacterium]NBO45185.1 hypothetical protein [Betaproteobacteria bacterium]NBQ10470.1 hypothetical protein [Betaproteobacteria bacterium]NBT64684.1 hypothetical protein [Betaproteobacteria bacterium]NCV05333.1 hypothetical protein [Betaproteobacteria bacterium]